MIQQELSNKIKVASFICTVMVLYRHSLNFLAFFDSWEGVGINKIVQNYFLRFTEIAVPYFFIISGFFFFQNNYYNISCYKSMIKKKLHTLAIPFFLWNLLFFIPYLLINKDEFSLTSFILDLFSSRFNTPLWYIRELLILMIFVPLYYWIFKINRFWIYALLGFVLLFYWIPVDTNIFSTEAVLFFFCGGLLSKYKSLIYKELNYRLLIFCVVLWVIISISYTDINMHKINTILGIFTFWNIVKHIPDSIYNKILNISSYSFIIYVFHSYPLKIIKNSIAILFKGNEIVALITFILLPFIVCYITIIIAKIWQKKSLRSYNIFTGNR